MISSFCYRYLMTNVRCFLCFGRSWRLWWPRLAEARLCPLPPPAPCPPPSSPVCLRGRTAAGRPSTASLRPCYCPRLEAAGFCPTVNLWAACWPRSPPPTPRWCPVRLWAVCCSVKSIFSPKFWRVFQEFPWNLLLYHLGKPGRQGDVFIVAYLCISNTIFSP